MPVAGRNLHIVDTDLQTDPRKALAYEESVRALTQQAGVVDALRTRTGILLTAISISSTFLGAQAIDQAGFSTATWFALGFFGGAGALALAVLWPRPNWHFTSDASVLIDGYIESDTPATLDEMHVDLAKFNQARWEQNGERLGVMFWLFRLSAAALVVEVGCWLVALGVD